MSLDDQIILWRWTKQNFTIVVNSIAEILSQRLVIQHQDNDTLPDLANVLQKQSRQVLLRHDIETINARFTIYYMLEIYTKKNGSINI